MDRSTPGNPIWSPQTASKGAGKMEESKTGGKTLTWLEGMWVPNYVRVYLGSPPSQAQHSTRAGKAVADHPRRRPIRKYHKPTATPDWLGRRCSGAGWASLGRSLCEENGASEGGRIHLGHLGTSMPPQDTDQRRSLQPVESEGRENQPIKACLFLVRGPQPHRQSGSLVGITGYGLRVDVQDVVSRAIYHAYIPYYTEADES
ncbi:hypothetical protein B0T22DRAFT_442242 [Podospora appendiculata]|uniref:Uncharacterized protein n=1 Tax=Podospora appendiculata TaxID=314037 RepID=A0AAE0X4G8_9PEZI|nr:hypothetical protein B0T22DRAFT_442242 [Podospora appendiculata]